MYGYVHISAGAQEVRGVSPLALELEQSELVLCQSNTLLTTEPSLQAPDLSL